MNDSQVQISKIGFNALNVNFDNFKMCKDSAVGDSHNYKGVKSNKTVRKIKKGKYATTKAVECSISDKLKFMEFADLIRIYGIEYGENCKEKDVLELVLYSEECVGI